MKTKCNRCDGWGWYADHDHISTHHPEDGSCMTCPVQVQCEDCQATGEIEEETSEA